MKELLYSIHLKSRLTKSSLPRYIYKCNECEKELEKAHSVNEVLTDCEFCNVSGSLQKVMPFVSFVSSRKENKKEKTGEIVKRFIEDSKEDLKEQKMEVKKREIKL